jgi:hypothetical protein
LQREPIAELKQPFVAGVALRLIVAQLGQWIPMIQRMVNLLKALRKIDH